MQNTAGDREELFGLVSNIVKDMLTPKQKKSLDRLIAKWLPKAKAEYYSRGVTVTYKSLAGVVKRSIVANNQEALDYFLVEMKKQL